MVAAPAAAKGGQGGQTASPPRPLLPGSAQMVTLQWGCHRLLYSCRHALFDLALLLLPPPHLQEGPIDEFEEVRLALEQEAAQRHYEVEEINTVLKQLAYAMEGSDAKCVARKLRRCVQL